MKPEDEDKVKQDRNGAAANIEPPQPTRRQVLKGLTTGTVAIGTLSPSVGGAAMPPLKTRGATDTTTVCPFCGVGCGQVVSTRNDTMINIEGDAGHPISEGTLCSKGAAAIQVVNNPRRLQKVLYRAPRGVGGEDLGLGPGADRYAGESDARHKLPDAGERPYRQPHGGHRLSRRLGTGQRGGLSPRETHAGPRPGVHRAPGPALTQLHGRRAGGLIWQRGDDQPLGRHAER
jgi:molybdopterin-dependent oxidoreductase iron-sulfur protein